MREPCRVRLADWTRDRASLQRIRRAVFVEEQKVPEALEWDGIDADCRHAIAENASGEPIGCARLLPDGHIGRVAVLASERGRGVGGMLLARMIALAAELGHQRAVVNAQTHALAFYGVTASSRLGPSSTTRAFRTGRWRGDCRAGPSELRWFLLDLRASEFAPTGEQARDLRPVILPPRRNCARQIWLRPRCRWSSRQQRVPYSGLTRMNVGDRMRSHLPDAGAGSVAVSGCCGPRAIRTVRKGDRHDGPERLRARPCCARPWATACPEGDSTKRTCREQASARRSLGSQTRTRRQRRRRRSKLKPGSVARRRRHVRRSHRCFIGDQGSATRGRRAKGRSDRAQHPRDNCDQRPAPRASDSEPGAAADGSRPASIWCVHQCAGSAARAWNSSRLAATTRGYRGCMCSAIRARHMCSAGGNCRATALCLSTSKGRSTSTKWPSLTRQPAVDDREIDAGGCTQQRGDQSPMSARRRNRGIDPETDEIRRHAGAIAPTSSRLRRTMYAEGSELERGTR